jgi:hypothetical protein
MQRKLIQTKGFVFSLEATIALLLFVLMLIALPAHKESSLKELLILEQENDFLRVWSAKETSPSQMLNDARQIFEENVVVLVGENPLNQTLLKNNSIVSEGTLLDSSLSEMKVKIQVNYD